MAGSAIVYLSNPEASATFSSHVLTVLGLGVPAIVSLVVTKKVQEQTNGRLHTVTADNVRMAQLLLRAGINPYDGRPFDANPITSESPVVTSSTE